MKTLKKLLAAILLKAYRRRNFKNIKKILEDF